jgi:hypothetical protein
MMIATNWNTAFLLEGASNLRIIIINGTEVKGCTYHMKESFLSVLRDGNEITEFYLPKDCPHFCSGCKTCFSKSEYLCPHAAHTGLLARC